MMGRTLYAATLLLSLHIAHSYILLTANLEDVHAIAKQIAASPVAHQINTIIRRASNLFNEQLNQPRGQAQMRADDGEATDGKESQREQRGRASASEGEGAAASGSERVERRHAKRRHGDELAALGKNASYYLASINKILKNV